jgi:uncharacterized protein
VYIVDANIFIYAFRRDSPFHPPCYAWLTQALTNGEEVTAPSVVELAVVRICTLPSLGDAAATPQAVFAFFDSLNENGYERLEPATTHQAYWSQACQELALRGNDVNDAFLAALALENSATLVSADEGFKRFKRLSWLNPLSTKG